MRKSLLAISVGLIAVTVFVCYGSALLYLALLSTVPLAYGLWKKENAPLFPVMLGLAFVMRALTFPWDAVHILLISSVWPGLFAVFALHSVPPSKDMEMKAGAAWMTSTALSAGILFLIPGMVYTIPNTHLLALMGLMAGLALSYLAWK